MAKGHGPAQSGRSGSNGAGRNGRPGQTKYAPGRKAKVAPPRRSLALGKVVAVVGAGVLVGAGAGFAVGHAVGNPSAAPASSTSGPAADRADTVAAQIGDLVIMESEVTDYIEVQMRADQTTGETMGDADWVSYLESYDWTPETAREAVIRNVFTLSSVIVAEAASAGITPDQTEIDSELQEQKTTIGEADWGDWLVQNGYRDEDFYVLHLQATAVYEDLMTANVEFTSPTQDQVDAYVESSASEYAGPRVSMIYLPYGEDGGDSADAARGKAEEAIARLAAGESFASLAEEYNATDSTGAGGDVGWGNTGNLPEVCATALETMGVDDVSGVLDGGAEFLIVTVTEEYLLPEDATVALAAVPESLRTQLGEELASDTAADAEAAYYQELIDSDLVTVSPMPKGLPYDVAMEAATGE
ncbi:MAG: peptidylprolyl isomerase [Bifidobacteriaceae bacterium]|nr:peptidylprolyl isomerase [Bifidobacteriaceae bacterium]